MEFLESQGHEWIDVQMVTEVVAAMGGKYIERDEFLEMLEERHQQLRASP